MHIQDSDENVATQEQDDILDESLHQFIILILYYYLYYYL